MKYIVRILGVIAVSALTVFTMSVCDDGGNKGASNSSSSSSQGTGNSSLYTWADDIYNYELTITESARTAVTSGSYSLVIIKIDNPADKKTVSGTATGGSGGQITLSNTGGTPIIITIAANRTTITIPAGAEIYISTSEKIQMGSGSRTLGGADAGDGGINFNDAKWKNLDVYVAVYSNHTYSHSDPYTGGAKTFSKAILTGTQEAVSLSAISSATNNWNINIGSNNKFSVALGNPDKATPASSIPDSINKQPADLKLVLIDGFVDDSGNAIYWFDPAGEFIDMVVFAYANKAGVVSGSTIFDPQIGKQNYNLNLKAGWNTIIVTEYEDTMIWNIVTGVPGSNYKWYYEAAE